MMRGIYVAGTGLLDRSRALDITANNLANASTAGFKRDGLVSASFGQYVTWRTGDGEAETIGGTTHGVVASQVYTLHGQAGFEETGRKLDFAIEGDGYFTVQRPDGTVALTRSGQFQVDQDGFLTDGSGNLVLGQFGPMQVGQTGSLDTAVSGLSVLADGSVFFENAYIDTLRVTVPGDPAALTKAEGGLFVGGGNVLPFAGAVRQGMLERSNVSVSEEMADMIRNSRQFQSCSQMIRMMDSILQKTVTEIGRL